MPHPSLVEQMLDQEVKVAAEQLTHFGVQLQRDGTRVHLSLPELTDGTRITFDGPDYDTEPLGLSVTDSAGMPVGVDQWPQGLVYGELHPVTKRPFACLQGLKEYFEHPGHCGERWDQHRGQLRLIDLIRHILSKTQQ
jgi:hypothetical protein